MQDNDIWLATPDGARKQQVTHTGGYFYVSQADNGAAGRARRWRRSSRSSRAPDRC